MPGGLLNIISHGSANIILTGNPTKTFFKVAYSKYTNFGMQKFRLDYEGSRELRLTEPSVYTFKMKRYGDLLMDTYLVVNLPNIWSPIWMPSGATGVASGNGNYWSPYEFKWIEDLGAQMISSIEVQAGSVTIQRYSGQYLSAMVQRDFTKEKRDLFDKMSGNTTDLNDPANNPDRVATSPFLQNTYPTAKFQGSFRPNTITPDWFSPNNLTSSVSNINNTLGAEPSIRGRTLYIPLNLWFAMDSRCAFPLISTQYVELTIQITLRPIQELFRIRDVFNISNMPLPPQNIGYDTLFQGPYMQPNFMYEQCLMYRFLQPPTSTDLSTKNYNTAVNTWNADVHLLATYCFLSKEEQELFAAKDQIYLVKDIYEYDFLNLLGSAKVKLNNSNRMVSSWMWFFQRNDVFLRNEWNNYTNWPYNRTLPNNYIQDPSYNGGVFYITGPYSQANQKDILETLGIVFNGDYRETTQPAGVYNYVEKYTRTHGNAKDGLYCYNFCLNTDPREYQPSGAINMSKFKTVELAVTTFLPPIDTSGANVNIACNDMGTPISISSKPPWALYQYSYNMHLMEEQYNILSFVGGNCGLMYAR